MAPYDAAKLQNLRGTLSGARGGGTSEVASRNLQREGGGVQTFSSRAGCTDGV